VGDKTGERWIMTRHRQVLVLNKCWTPVGVVGMERAVALLFGCYKNGEPKARIIDPTSDFQTFTWADWSLLKPKEGEDFLRGVEVVFRVPKVILLSRYEKMPQQRVHFSRRTIYRMYHNVCQYCGKKYPTEELTIEHVVPRSRGGETSWTNCTLACVGCNARKANRTPEEAGMKLLTKPYKPKFSIFKGDQRIKEWDAFLGEAYWSVELDNDMK
jgi:5-methylcytosine-specific restriction endonuclease McrA